MNDSNPVSVKEFFTSLQNENETKMGSERQRLGAKFERSPYDLCSSFYITIPGLVTKDIMLSSDQQHQLRYLIGGITFALSRLDQNAKDLHFCNSILQVATYINSCAAST